MQCVQKLTHVPLEQHQVEHQTSILEEVSIVITLEQEIQ